MANFAATSTAAMPVVRQIIQHLAGVILGAGVLNESEATIVAGALIAVGNLVWMLRAKAKQA